MAKPRLCNNKVTRILNALADHKSVKQAVEDSETSTTSVYKIIEDFPLWSHYLKSKD